MRSVPGLVSRSWPDTRKVALVTSVVVLARAICAGCAPWTGRSPAKPTEVVPCGYGAPSAADASVRVSVLPVAGLPDAVIVIGMAAITAALAVPTVTLHVYSGP